MKKFLTFKMRKLSLLLSVVLSFWTISPMSAFAANPNDIQNNIALAEAGITMEEAIEMFDLTDEEAERATFYVMDANDLIPSSSQLGGQASTMGVIDVDHPWLPAEFHFTGYNVGSYQTMNGNYLKYRLIWKPDAGDGSQFCEVELYGYGLSTHSDWALLTLGSPVYSEDASYRTYVSNWINIYYGLDYHLIYNSQTGHGGMYPTDYGCYMRVILVVV